MVKTEPIDYSEAFRDRTENVINIDDINIWTLVILCMNGSVFLLALYLYIFILGHAFWFIILHLWSLDLKGWTLQKGTECNLSRFWSLYYSRQISLHTYCCDSCQKASWSFSNKRRQTVLFFSIILNSWNIFITHSSVSSPCLYTIEVRESNKEVIWDWLHEFKCKINEYSLAPEALWSFMKRRRWETHKADIHKLQCSVSTFTVQQLMKSWHTETAIYSLRSVT